MPELNEIDYRVLIERSIKDFRPVKRLWPVSSRLLFWIVLDVAILALTLSNGWRDAGSIAYLHNYGFEAAGFFLVSIAAAWLALRSSIPGRETGTTELMLLIIGIIAATVIVEVEPLSRVPLSLAGLSSTLARQLSFAALPWLALFWAARRAVPLRAGLTAGMIGIAASCSAIAADLFAGPIYPIIWELGFGAIFTALSVVAGERWLNPERLWRKDSSQLSEDAAETSWLEARIIFPTAAALIAGLLLVVLRLGIGGNEPVHDFDLAIENYQQSLANFRPNVPSNSVGTVLTAYIERGMPSYMWDFGPQGFKLVGGRFERLPDGTPVTYTWFRGTSAGVMCMFKQVSGFQPPAADHLERDHMLFYRYRGYSVCLLNVGGYGDFVSVIVSPIPMKPFVHMVLDSLSAGQRSS